MTLVLGLCTYVSLLMVLARDTSPSTRVFFVSRKHPLLQALMSIHCIISESPFPAYGATRRRENLAITWLSNAT